MKKTIHSNQDKIFREWLKSKRLESNLTIRELAIKLDRHHSVIGKIEIGERRLDVIEYIAYCEALDADPNEGIKILI